MARRKRSTTRGRETTSVLLRSIDHREYPDNHFSLVACSLSRTAEERRKGSSLAAIGSIELNRQLLLSHLLFLASPYLPRQLLHRLVQDDELRVPVTGIVDPAAFGKTTLHVV